MVGTIEPRKGHAQTLSAFERLWENGYDINLVIVGKKGWLVDELIDRLCYHPELEEHLFWLEGISDEYLEKVYAASVCLIAASEGEGFGLPLIEAARHKLPIIARDIPAFREVAGEYAFYFKGKESTDLVEVIKGWLVLYSKKQHPYSDNMPWLTWKESAKNLVDKLCTEDFSQSVKNTIKSISGFSELEHWGRWTDFTEAKIIFFDKLPKNFTLVLRVKAFGPNMGKPVRVLVGHQEQVLLLDSTIKEHHLLFNNHDESNELTFFIPKPTSPAELGMGEDFRKLGIGIGKLSIK
jgi:hypothetical protein